VDDDLERVADPLSVRAEGVVDLVEPEVVGAVEDRGFHRGHLWLTRS
jgi:hypothetical protein